MSQKTMNLSDERSGLLPTPPLPADLGQIDLTENARQVLVRRYVRRDRDGKPAESVEEMFWRVAYHVAAVESAWNGDVLARARQYYALLTEKRFFPNSPTFTGAGTPLGQLAACFVLPISDDMGRDPAGIFQTLRNAALIQQTGGGNGFSFSRLRPKGALVRSSAGQATGPVGFLRVYDKAFGEIAQGGSRRGANMAVLRVDHPDIEEFVTCKTDENAITNFNISVGITDAFMEAVRKDTGWDLRFIDLGDPQARRFQGTLEQAEAAGIPIRVYRTLRARDLFDKIVRQAHHNGEPGLLFLDAANRANPVPHLYQLESTNPCFAGATRIATDCGLLTIQELAEMETPALVATDSRAPWGGQGQPDCRAQGVAFRPALPAWKTHQNAEVLRLVTRHGYRVVATPDHKFLTPDRGYVELGQLRPGSRLLLQSGEGAWSKIEVLPGQERLRLALAALVGAGSQTAGAVAPDQDFMQLENLPSCWSYELGVVLGWLIADGWLSSDSHSAVGMAFETSDSAPQEIVHGFMSEWFGPGQLHEREAVRQFTYGRLPYEFFAALGVQPALTHARRVPDSIWQAPRQAVVGFLQGLFTADGTVNLLANKKACSIRLTNASLDLLRDVQQLLLNFGIVSRLAIKRPVPQVGLEQSGVHTGYELRIDKANRGVFMEKIGFLSADRQSQAAGFSAATARRSQAENFETSILSIEPAGVMDVYDLTEPQTHSVIANGIVAHQCGEQFLGSFENCCLGSVNLAQHCGPEGSVDWDGLGRSVELATTFLDDVVEANAYVPAVPQLKEAAHLARRIGLGLMGLADLMYHAGIRYGSPEGEEFGAQVMEFVRYQSMRTSIELAKQRGAFPAIQGSLYDPAALRWQPPQALVEYTHDWDRPLIDWEALVDDLRTYGIRNAAQTTVAPTGTIATVAGCEGYGCEPVFALAYIRHVNDNGKDLQLTYASPLFEAALQRAGLSAAARQAAVEHIMQRGTCQGLDEIPEEIRQVFVVSHDIQAEEHVRMQAALQAFVDNSLSKTINFPEGASEQDVATAYQLAWELGCKGITVYITGSRQKVVLETAATVRAKNALAAVQPAPAPSAPGQQMTIWHDKKKPRPRSLRGYTYNIHTPLGKAFVTINENGGNQPFEVFINTSKAGSDTAAVSEAIGRLISYLLRLASPVAPRDRLKEIWRQLSGIGGGRSLGFGPNRVRSLPDGVAQALSEYLESTSQEHSQANSAETESSPAVPPPPAHAPEQPMLRIGDLCPECGQAAVVNEEGCRKCYACGYSEC